MRPVLTVLVLTLALTGCAETIARSRVKTALVEAGLSEPVSNCMSGHMVDKLSLLQLRKLEALQGPKTSAFDYVRAVRKIDDPEVWRVTAAAAGLCMSGWER